MDDHVGEETCEDIVEKFPGELEGCPVVLGFERLQDIIYSSPVMKSKLSVWKSV